MFDCCIHPTTAHDNNNNEKKKKNMMHIPIICHGTKNSLSVQQANLSNNKLDVKLPKTQLNLTYLFFYYSSQKIRKGKIFKIWPK